MLKVKKDSSGSKLELPSNALGDCGIWSQERKTRIENAADSIVPKRAVPVYNLCDFWSAYYNLTVAVIFKVCKLRCRGYYDLQARAVGDLEKLRSVVSVILRAAPLAFQS